MRMNYYLNKYTDSEFMYILFDIKLVTFVCSTN